MKKKLLIISLIVLVIIFILIFLLSNNNYKLSNHEAVAYTSLRTAIATSELDGTGTITKDNFETLGLIAKNFNKNNTWFDSIDYTYYTKNMDTSENQIIAISDGTYIAKFTIKKDPTNYYLVDYSFEQGTLTGSTKVSIQK